MPLTDARETTDLAFPGTLVQSHFVCLLAIFQRGGDMDEEEIRPGRSR